MHSSKGSTVIEAEQFAVDHRYPTEYSGLEHITFPLVALFHLFENHRQLWFRNDWQPSNAGWTPYPSRHSGRDKACGVQPALTVCDRNLELNCLVPLRTTLHFQVGKLVVVPLGAVGLGERVASRLLDNNDHSLVPTRRSTCADPRHSFTTQTPNYC